MVRTLRASCSFHVALLDGVTGSGKTDVIARFPDVSTVAMNHF
ncbi:hypothetical protein [Bradyrhizobium sp. LMG 9283]